MPRTINTITAANSVLMLSIRDLFPAPIRIQGYSADAAFESEGAEAVEVMKGVDGVMSAGFTPYMVRMTITLNADSPSREFFEQWQLAMNTAREIYWADGSVILPSVHRAYEMNKGALTNNPPIPSARRVLQPTAFVITWDAVVPVPVP